MNSVGPSSLAAELGLFLRDDPYFQAHRSRFESNLTIVRRFCRQGEMLDVGCAPCHFTALLKISGYPIAGVDLNPARCRPVIEKFGLTVLPCDIERQRLPFADGAFQCVLFNEVLEHLRLDPLFALSEINRVLKEGGILMLTTPNLYGMGNVIRYLSGRGLGDPVREFSKLRGGGHMGHIREYSRAEALRFLERSRFRVEKAFFQRYEIAPAANGASAARSAIARAAYALLPARFRPHQIILARKAGPPPGLKPLPAFRLS